MPFQQELCKKDLFFTVHSTLINPFIYLLKLVYRMQSDSICIRTSLGCKSVSLTTIRATFLLLLVWTGAAVGLKERKLVYNSYGLLAAPTIPDSEWNALFDLYNATNGKEWHWRTLDLLDKKPVGIPWNFSDPALNNPCVDKWQGISCSFSSPYEHYNIVGIDLPMRNLTGTLPDSLGTLVQLELLYLLLNQLTGTIPKSLGNLVQLEYVDLRSNQFIGSLPESLGNLTRVTYLSFFSNQLNGTIPESLGKMKQLQYLFLFGNQLTGSIPRSLGNLVKLLHLSMYGNKLSSSIPMELSKLSLLQYLNLDTNRLTGTISPAIGDLTQLQSLQLYNNYLTGTIPESLRQLVLLRALQLNSNRLTGTIPNSLNTLTNLTFLDLDTNYLTGTIPELTNLSVLQYVYLFNNHLFGSIPASLGNLTQLVFLHLYSNELTGTIPSIFVVNLLQLELYENHLTGRIPSLMHLPLLQVVLLQNNRLTGNLDSVFDPTTQLQMESIVLHNNLLSGTLPHSMFQLKLQTFVGTSNCFEGPLPTSAICNNLNTVSFIVDGMSSAAACRNKLFVGSLSAYSLLFSIGGSIPTCLFQLPNITTLHLSGNGFTGSIPGDIVLSTTLTDLSLSHNVLTGSIPDQIQLRNWHNIDMSYNRLSGTLLPDFAVNGSVELENNRLSGVVPSSLYTLLNISVLGSNTFSCPYDKSDLPKHDPDRIHYHCGSSSFEIMFYLWLGATVCAVAVYGIYEWKYQGFGHVFQKDVSFQRTSFYTTLSIINHTSLKCVCYSLLVLLPLYSFCNEHYGTQTHKYAYQVSAVYMSGAVPFALYWCFWLILAIGIASVLLSATSNVARTASTERGETSSWHTLLSIFVPYLFIDCVVVAGVNAAYVYVAVYQSSSLLLVVQTLLSVFKIA